MSTIKVADLQHTSNSNDSISIASDSSVALKHSGNQKLITTATGVDITGACTATSFTGDGAKRDDDGFYWITGRVDDVINVSGHRLGTAEIESALVSHETVAEAAVVGFPHDIKGQGIYAYVTLKAGIEGNQELYEELVKTVSTLISPIAKPEKIQWQAAYLLVNKSST